VSCLLAGLLCYSPERMSGTLSAVDDVPAGHCCKWAHVLGGPPSIVIFGAVHLKTSYLQLRSEVESWLPEP